jgi:hypothetical protein
MVADPVMDPLQAMVAPTAPPSRTLQARIMRVIILYLLAPTVTGTLLVPDSRLMARATEPHTMTSTL